MSNANDMQAVLQNQKTSFINDGFPSAALRKDRMNRGIALLVDNREALRDAAAADFGHRSKDQTDFTDIAMSIGAFKHTIKHVDKWMKPEKRGLEFPLGLLGARGQILPTPKGSVGIIAPWNFPISMVFIPLANTLGAGNRAMIKPSEFTEQTSALMADLVPKYYSEEEVAIFTGGPDVGQAFSQLDLDHMFFTGATSVARHIMRAAAENLTPVTLELGGKSPAILGAEANVELAAKRIMAGKMLNAGQICLAPDYALAQESQIGAFVDHAKAAAAAMYPTLKDNDDYTSIVNQRHYDRLNGYLEDAKSKGGELIEVNPAGENFTQQPHHKMAPVLVLNPSDDMDIMKDEIFGPILPVKSYTSLDEAIAYVNQRARPLGLYYFGDSENAEKVTKSTHSGGVTLNDCIFHGASDDLPFGGVGDSGMGTYHGEEGFREFSHHKTIMKQSGVDKALAMFRPPYGKTYKKQVESRIKK